MISAMSLRHEWLSVLVASAVGVATACGGERGDASEPQTARDKLRSEEAASDDPGAGKAWGKWRYKGERGSCFFRLGAKCFATEAKACASARCKKPTKCASEGAAPAQVSCK
jgi:hypothetical protein